MAIPKMTDGALTVKEYAAKNHVSEQSVYAKINRNYEKLRCHILRQNGKTLLDLTAQEMLKPTDANFRLAQKVGSLENELRDKTYESDKRKKQSEELNIECKNLKEQLAECERRIKMLNIIWITVFCQPTFSLFELSTILVMPFIEFFKQFGERQQLFTVAFALFIEADVSRLHRLSHCSASGLAVYFGVIVTLAIRSADRKSVV